MNKVKCLSMITLVLLFCFGMQETIFAYGWGYKKAADHGQPDFGKYEGILQSHQAFYMDTSPKNKEIYVTFDNGYEAGHTAKILNVLKKHHIPATFFVTGHYVSSEPELIKRMVSEGHIIGNHSVTHKDFTTLSKKAMTKELDDLEKAVATLTPQKEMMYLRPPRGTFNEETLTWADELGYHHVFWSLAFKDWETDKQKGWKYAYDEMMEQIHPGAIILLHTVSADNANALEQVIIDAQKAGYTFRSLDDLYIKQTLGEFPIM